MAYVEIRKNGRLIARRPVEDRKAQAGLRVRIGSAGEVLVSLGKPATLDCFEVRVVAAEPPDDRRGQETAVPTPQVAGRLPDGLDFSAAQPVPRQPVMEALPEIEGYRVLAPLGHGGMGTVWHAEQLSTRREVALKLMIAPGPDSAKARARFEREVELTARLDHPNIGRVYDSGLHAGRYYYAMERIDGMPLDRYVQRMNLPAREVLSLMRTVCQAVHYAHLHGVIHRDLKPSNIMVGHDGQPHVLDFGLARSFLHEEEAVTISLEGEVSGTPAYMSPEQARGHQDQIDTRTDVFSLGVILYHLLTGRSPHDLSGSVYDVLQRVIEGRITRPREASRSIDRELDAILLCALATDPARRYASAGELADDLDDYLQGEPLRARIPTTFYLLRKKARKHWRQVSAVGAVVMVVLGTVMGAYTMMVSQRASYKALLLKEKLERLSIEGLNARVLQGDKGADAALSVLLDRYIAAEEKIGALNHQLGQHTPAVPARAVGLNAGMPLGVTALVRTPYLPGPVTSWTLETMGHRAGVAKLAFSPDGRWLASAGQEGTVRLWEVRTGALSGILVDPNGPAADLGWSGDSNALVALDSDGRTRWWVWDWPTRTLAPVPASSESSFARAAAGRSWSSSIDAGNPSAEEVLSRWNVILRGDRRSPSRAATCMALSEDRRTLALADADGVISLLDAESGLRRVASAPSWCGPVRSIAFSTKGDLFATCSGAGTLCLWDAHCWQPLLKFQAATIGAADSSMAGVFCWAHDGNALAVAPDRAGAVDIMDISSGRGVRTLSGGNRRIASVDWSADGGTFVAGTADGSVLIWDMSLPSADAQRELAVGGSDVSAVLLQGDPLLVAAVSSAGRLGVWDVREGRLFHILTNRAGAGACLAAAPDAKTLVSVGPDGRPCLWDPLKGELTRTFRSDPNRPGSGERLFSAVAWSLDGQRLATGDSEGWISVWDSATGDIPRSFQTSCGCVTSLAWSRDGQLLLCGGRDGTARAWDAKNGYRHHATMLPLWGSAGAGVALSPEGDYRGPPQIEDHLAYVVQTDKGQAMLSPTEFNAQHGWVNEPWQVGLYRPGAEPMERIYVNADAPGPFDGRTWATAFNDLQDALSAARPNTEIWVARGVYTPDRGTGARIASFNLKNGVRLYGGFTGNETRVHERDPKLQETVLSGDLKHDDKRGFVNCDENSYHVVTAHQICLSTVVDGFLITGGNADGLMDHKATDGGGIHSEALGLTFVNCRIEFNSAAQHGGGMYHDAGQSDLTLISCTFSNNRTTIHPRLGHGWGGGMCISGATGTVVNSVFDHNAAHEGGAAFLVGAVDLVLRDCTFSANRCESRGGAIHNWTTTTLAAVNCRFIENAAALHGGGIFNEGGSETTLVNCLLVHNSGDDDGGGVFNWPSGDGPAFAYLINCTLVANTSRSRTGCLVCVPPCTATLSNCILWANTGGATPLESAQLGGEGITVSRSCIEGWSGRFGGVGNSGQDPGFLDPNGPDGKIGTLDDDLRLAPDSPCRDAGDNSAVPADMLDLDGDGDPDEPIPFDVAGRPRIQNGHVDLGAHESDPHLPAR